MIAVRISPPIPMAIVASEEYLQQRGTPSDPHDLRQHQCLNLRMPTSGALHDWKLGRRKKNDTDQTRRAARIQRSGADKACRVTRHWDCQPAARSGQG